MSSLIKSSGLVPIEPTPKTLTAQASYTSPTWTASAYKRIVVRFYGMISGGATVGFLANGDTASNYAHLGWTAAGAGGAFDTSGSGTLGYSKIAVANTAAASPATGEFSLEFFPLKQGTNPRRAGFSAGHMYANTDVLASHASFAYGFAWNNTAADVTSVSIILSTAETMTGIVEVYGDPA